MKTFTLPTLKRGAIAIGAVMAFATAGFAVSPPAQVLGGCGTSQPDYTVATTQNWDNNLTYFVDANIIVPSGVTLTISQGAYGFNVNKGITVEAGGRLIVTSHLTMLTSCSLTDLWSGITVEGSSADVQSPYTLQGSMHVSAGATISRAEHAFTQAAPPLSGGILTAENAFFTDNRNTAQFLEYATVNESHMTDCEVVITSSYKDYAVFSNGAPEIPDQVTVNLNNGLELRGNTFRNDYSIGAEPAVNYDQVGAAVKVTDGSIIAGGNADGMAMPCGAPAGIGNTFIGWADGIYITTTSSGSTSSSVIYYNDFFNNHHGIFLINSADADIYYNSFLMEDDADNRLHWVSADGFTYSPVEAGIQVTSDANLSIIGNTFTLDRNSMRSAYWYFGILYRTAAGLAQEIAHNEFTLANADNLASSLPSDYLGPGLIFPTEALIHGISMFSSTAPLIIEFQCNTFDQTNIGGNVSSYSIRDFALGEGILSSLSIEAHIGADVDATNGEAGRNSWTDFSGTPNGNNFYLGANAQDITYYMNAPTDDPTINHDPNSELDETPATLISACVLPELCDLITYDGGDPGDPGDGPGFPVDPEKRGNDQLTEGADALVVYPNPANEMLRFSEMTSGTLFDLGGRLVLTMTQQNELNVSSLEPGTYFFQTSSNETISVIIQR